MNSGFYPCYDVFVGSPAEPKVLVQGASHTTARAMAEQQARVRGVTVYMRNLMTGSVEAVHPTRKAV
jgi:hypothetical protein